MASCPPVVVWMSDRTSAAACVSLLPRAGLRVREGERARQRVCAQPPRGWAPRSTFGGSHPVEVRPRVCWL